MPLQRLLVHVVLESDSERSLEATVAALRSAIQVGLNGNVLSLDAFPLAAAPQEQAPQQPTRAKPPPSKPSDRDQVVEEYTHSGMTVQIWRNAGRTTRPTYFAVVVNPQAKQPSGAVISAGSYQELKGIAETRAERKAELLQRRKATQPRNQ